MTRRHYLISYDISDDKRRRKVFEALKDEGEHLQYSVFACPLDRAELAKLRHLLRELIHDREDQVLFIDIGADSIPLDQILATIGKGYEPPSRHLIV